MSIEGANEEQKIISDEEVPLCEYCCEEYAEVHCLCDFSNYCLKCAALHMIDSILGGHMLERIGVISKPARDYQQKISDFEQTLSHNEKNRAKLDALILRLRTDISNEQTLALKNLENAAKQIKLQIDIEFSKVQNQINDYYKSKFEQLSKMQQELISNGFVEEYNDDSLKSYSKYTVQTKLFQSFFEVKQASIKYNSIFSNPKPLLAGLSHQIPCYRKPVFPLSTVSIAPNPLLSTVDNEPITFKTTHSLKKQS